MNFSYTIFLDQSYLDKVTCNTLVLHIEIQNHGFWKESRMENNFVFCCDDEPNLYVNGENQWILPHILWMELIVLLVPTFKQKNNNNSRFSESGNLCLNETKVVKRKSFILLFKSSSRWFKFLTPRSLDT